MLCYMASVDICQRSKVNESDGCLSESSDVFDKRQVCCFLNEITFIRYSIRANTIMWKREIC